MKDQVFYTTSQAAASVGIHANTVRMYEDAGLIPKPDRKENGYRIFTQRHIEQLKLVRLAFKTEITHNGLRKRAIRIIKTSAIGDYKNALEQTQEYLEQVRKEKKQAVEAVKTAENLLKQKEETQEEKEPLILTRQQTAKLLNITTDTLRNWERNGLLQVKNKKNGYHIYDKEDIKRLKIIRALRSAHYSLAAILRMLYFLPQRGSYTILELIDTPNETEEIISVCDKLVTSLTELEKNSIQMLSMLENMAFLEEKIQAEKLL